jgi:hypothetical protein
MEKADQGTNKYGDAEELYKRRLQEVRSDDERGRLKEDHKLEIGWIRALGAEEYHTQLELERQQRKWALGQPIDAKWKDALMRKHRKIFESYKPAEPSPSRTGAQSSRSNEHAHAEGTAGLPIRNKRYDPSAYEIWRANINAAEGAGTRRGLARRGSTASQRSIGSNSIYSLTAEPILERPDGSERNNVPTRDNGEQVASPPVRSLADRSPGLYYRPQRWNPDISAEEEGAGPGRGLAGRGNTASQRSVASSSIRSLTIEPILEPDGHERDNVARQNDGEPVASSPDKGKERQHQSRTFQLATQPTERWEKSSAPGTGNPKLPNSAPPERQLADRSPGPYYRPHRWSLDISAEVAGPGWGSTASQRPLTIEPILERPDGDSVLKKDNGERVAASPDKGKERQDQRGTFQLTTEPNGRWEEPPAPGMGNPKLPNSAPPVRSLADRPYYRPHRWSLDIFAEEEAAGTQRGRSMRGSTASQHSVGSNSIRSLTTEPILEWPDGSERVNVPRKDDGESVASSPDKGKNRQRQRGTFQSTTVPNGRWEEPPAPGMGNPKLPNSAPPVRSLADRSPGLYNRPQRWSPDISAEEELAGPGRGSTAAFLLTTESHGRREQLPIPGSSSPPLSESFHETLQLLLVTLMEVRFSRVSMPRNQQLLIVMGCPRSPG